MAKKEKKKPNKNESNPESDAPEKVDPRVLKIGELHDLIKTNKREQRSKTAMMQKLTLPLKRINSLPSIHASLPIVHTLFPGSKSVNLGFEPPVPDIPNAEVFLDEVPTADLLKKFKAMTPPPAVRPALSFMGENVDKTDLGLLDVVAKQDSHTFLEQRVGKENFEAIIKNEELFEDVLKSNRKWTRAFKCKICLILLLLLVAIIAGSGYYLSTLQAPVPTPFPNTTVMTTTEHVLQTVPVNPSQDPFTYLPRPKSYQLFCPFIEGIFSCNKFGDIASLPNGDTTSQHVINRLYSIYGFGVRDAMTNLGFPIGNVLILSSKIFNDRIEIFLSTFFLPRSVATLNWYGIDFVNEGKSIKNQTYIFIERLLLPRLVKAHLECTVDYEKLLDCGTYYKVIGQLYKKYVEPEKPEEISEDVKGIIARYYNS
uniref:Uncharacterized LOC100185943 n=1 Tax=Ciona intestinalis TaxID=7719 RepID=F6Z2S3_CIOIN|nr:uncharacterized protein LOC100185943 [Ciona intestinalis]|eukprot:XP_002120370.1 uncharacterized protein LOC100185943 [Ciona intestinalis]